MPERKGPIYTLLKKLFRRLFLVHDRWLQTRHRLLCALPDGRGPSCTTCWLERIRRQRVTASDLLPRLVAGLLVHSACSLPSLAQDRVLTGRESVALTPAQQSVVDRITKAPETVNLGILKATGAKSEGPAVDRYATLVVPLTGSQDITLVRTRPTMLSARAVRVRRTCRAHAVERRPPVRLFRLQGAAFQHQSHGRRLLRYEAGAIGESLFRAARRSTWPVRRRACGRLRAGCPWTRGWGSERAGARGKPPLRPLWRGHFTAPPSARPNWPWRRGACTRHRPPLPGVRASLPGHAGRVPPRLRYARAARGCASSPCAGRPRLPPAGPRPA